MKQKTHKTCKLCSVSLPLTKKNFYRIRDGKGREFWRNICKGCESKERLRYYRLKRARVSACRTCQEIFPRSEEGFPSNPKTGTLRHICHKCTKRRESFPYRVAAIRLLVRDLSTTEDLELWERLYTYYSQRKSRWIVCFGRNGKVPIISVAEYLRKLREQNFRCAVCKTKPKRSVLIVDHDHTSGSARGLLCHTCNVGIGFFKDKLDFLQEAIIYLTR
jgi:hypothetical protein